MQELRSLKIDLFLHQQGLDTTTPAGKMMFQVLGSFAEYERDMIRARVNAGIATLHVRRVKNGKAATHPIRGDEMRALRKLQREAPRSAFVFVNERGTPFSPDGFNWLVKRAGQKAGLPFQVHAHMLRHSAGYKLAGDGHDTRAIQDYLGHRNISNTVRYTELSPTRFKDFWRD
jgi:site-specific recombinase XerD